MGHSRVATRNRRVLRPASHVIAAKPASMGARVLPNSCGRSGPQQQLDDRAGAQTASIACAMLRTPRRANAGAYSPSFSQSSVAFVLYLAVGGERGYAQKIDKTWCGTITRTVIWRRKSDQTLFSLFCVDPDSDPTSSWAIPAFPILRALYLGFYAVGTASRSMSGRCHSPR